MFKLRKLLYDINTFSDSLGAGAFSYHHGKHHQACVNNLNNLIQSTEFAGEDLVSITKNPSGEVLNSAAQVHNRDFYFNCITPSQSTCECPNLKAVLEKSFGSLESFRDELIKGAIGVFGSGRFRLVLDSKMQKLEFVGISNAITSVCDDKVPLSVVDVWEHAYHIDHRNARPAYLKKFYAHINWAFIARAYERALKESMSSISFYANELHPVK